MGNLDLGAGKYTCPFLFKIKSVDFHIVTINVVRCPKIVRY